VHRADAEGINLDITYQFSITFKLLQVNKKV